MTHSWRESVSIPVSSEARRQQQTSIEEDAHVVLESPPIFDFIDRRKWRKVRQLLKRHVRRNELHSIVDSTGLTPLAYAMSCRAPLDIVEMILQGDPESTVKTDDFKATPLHLACLNGATYETVKMVLDYDKSQELVRMKDKSGSSVLHHAVEYACDIIEKKINCIFEIGRSSEGSPTWSESTSTARDSTIDECEYLNECLNVIQLLCEVAPDLVFDAGLNGATPLDIPNIYILNLVELATTTREDDFYLSKEDEERMADKFLEVYKIMKNTAVSLYRRRKLEWESQGLQEHVLSTPGEEDNANKSQPALHSLSSPSISAPTNTLSRGSNNLSLFKDSVVEGTVPLAGNQKFFRGRGNRKR